MLSKVLCLLTVGYLLTVKQQALNNLSLPLRISSNTISSSIIINEVMLLVR